jgi:SpoVK/Ycf46/Vps4 family AAA+-type ATPase
MEQDICNELMVLPPEIRDQYIKSVRVGASSSNKGKIDTKAKVFDKAVLYDFNATNTNISLKELTEKLLLSNVLRYGILLYGESGSGKSLWAQYLSQQLGMPFIKKRASDLIGSLVGQSEANIAQAFAEARDKKAVLVIDEADTFLFDRTKASQMYQVGTTNEFLTQMEDHPYPIIMTTNLKDKIDNACFRRFTFKIKFEYMTPENIEAAITTFFKKKITLKEEERDALVYLTAGDFKVAKQKIDILENKKYTRENIIKYLKQEQTEKNIKKSSTTIRIGA